MSTLYNRRRWPAGAERSPVREHVGALLLSILPLAGLLSGCGNGSSSHTAVDSTNTRHPIGLCRQPVSAAGLKRVDELGPPQLRQGMGNSHLPITTSSKSAQKWFDYGVNLLHSFWHLEAYRAFREVIKADSACAMGYWGIAMCQPGFGGDDNQVWQNAISKAKTLQGPVSPVEKGLINATDMLVHQGIYSAVSVFRQLVKAFPDQPEVLAFSAIVLRQNVRTDDHQASSNEVKGLLESGLSRFPAHTGLQHYYVHVMEVRPDFGSVAALAGRMVKTAPAASHITHMPGHIYFLQGRYKQAISAFEAARRLEEAYHKRENIPYALNQNYMHNLHYLAVAYSELGQKDKAMAAARQYAGITLSQETPQDGSALMLLYEGRILPALVHMRFREFAQAGQKISYWLNSQDMPLTNPLVRLYLEGMQAYCRGMAAVDAGDVQQAAQFGGQLTQQMQLFEQEGVRHQQSTEFKSINETYDILSMARYELAGWIDNMDKTKPFNDAAWKEALDLEAALAYDEPPRLMYPIGESLGRLHVRRGDPPQARKAFALALAKRPNSPLVKALETKQN